MAILTTRDRQECNTYNVLCNTRGSTKRHARKFAHLQRRHVGKAAPRDTHWRDGVVGEEAGINYNSGGRRAGGDAPEEAGPLLDTADEVHSEERCAQKAHGGSPNVVRIAAGGTTRDMNQCNKTNHVHRRQESVVLARACLFASHFRQCRVMTELNK